jgi:hypothetical protein
MRCSDDEIHAYHLRLTAGVSWRHSVFLRPCLTAIAWVPTHGRTIHGGQQLPIPIRPKLKGNEVGASQFRADLGFCPVGPPLVGVPLAPEQLDLACRQAAALQMQETEMRPILA